ncbi:hypothetical protein L226DRAFT_213891 [Lentinus tigrinus ALCF2SS1-7]|uniref:uncharacterized protein n=1 Tax=Lentinus tigrinus ALCF2SS1-7 TaxID=1328758 RepID=UPI001165EF34|nr:hypothetical protein L226DRAFT_213891 [Lentinus tigrinus ALCF2SS1-7]
MWPCQGAVCQRSKAGFHQARHRLAVRFQTQSSIDWRRGNLGRFEVALRTGIKRPLIPVPYDIPMSDARPTPRSRQQCVSRRTPERTNVSPDEPEESSVSFRTSGLVKSLPGVGLPAFSGPSYIETRNQRTPRYARRTQQRSRGFKVLCTIAWSASQNGYST